MSDPSRQLWETLFNEIYFICESMKGGIPYQTAWHLYPFERKGLIKKIISQREAELRSIEKHRK